MAGATIKPISIFMGERIGSDAAFEGRVGAALKSIGRYVAQKNMPVLYGCGHYGHAKTLRDVLERHDGEIVEAVPEFIDHQTRFAMLEDAKNEIETLESGNMPFNLASHNLSAVLEFKKNMMEHNGPRLVFPGFIGTYAEANISMEENDLAARLSLDVPLRPIVVLNIPMSNGEGFYDPLKAMLQRPVEIGRANKDRLNLVRFASGAKEAIALLDAYEALGPVPASKLCDFAPERVMDLPQNLDNDFIGPKAAA